MTLKLLSIFHLKEQPLKSACKALQPYSIIYIVLSQKMNTFQFCINTQEIMALRKLYQARYPIKG